MNGMQLADIILCHPNPIAGKRPMDMQKRKIKNRGLELLIQKYKREFETDENINYYNYHDYIRAQRKYVKFLLGNSSGPYNA